MEEGEEEASYLISCAFQVSVRRAWAERENSFVQCSRFAMNKRETRLRRATNQRKAPKCHQKLRPACFALFRPFFMVIF